MVGVWDISKILMEVYKSGVVLIKIMMSMCSYGGGNMMVIMLNIYV